MALTPVEIKSSILMGLASLRANKFRAGLTILGVMIGVASVIGLASIVNGLDAAFNNEIDSIGSNTLMITKLPFDFDHVKSSEEDRNRPPITEGEAMAIVENCPHIDGVSPQNYYFKSGGNDIKYKNRKGNRPRIMGTWPDYTKVTNSSVSEGRFISETDVTFRAMVCVIGPDLATVLFEEAKAVGKEIRVNGYRMEVVGVLERKESNFDNEGENNTVFMPLSSYKKMYPWEEELFLVVKADTYENVEIAKEEVIGALRVYRAVPFNKNNNFSISTQDNLKEFVSNITKYIYLAMVIITSVGLMVGGIGVMNIMLVSVTERTREIGIRKAVGAKRANIVLQFLTEAMTLSAVGGVVGIVIGSVGGLVINSILGFPVEVSFFWIITGFTVSVSVGLVSGIYPAYKAARLDPIESLRYE